MGRFQNNPSIGWVHPKSIHVCPLTWGNKKPWSQEKHKYRNATQ